MSDKHTKKAVKTKGGRRKKGCVIAMIAVMTLFGVFMVGVGTLLWQFRYNRNDVLDNKTDSDLGITNNTLSKDIINIALFGLDSRSATRMTGNSDSIMIISIDQIHNKIKLISIMRDSLVPIPGRGYGKINSAYGSGVETAIKTLNQNFGMNIRHYATVNFVGMADIIDAVGGIEVDITEEERNNANVHIRSMSAEVGTPRDYIAKAGKQTLNGVQAVSYARIRYVSNPNGSRDDFGRTDRQRYVMEQLFNKALNMKKSEYPGLIQKLLPYMETSLGYSDILNLAGILGGGVTFEQTRIPMLDYVINGDYREVTGSSTVYYNLQFAGKILHAFIYDDISPETYLKTNEIDKTGWV